MDGRYFFICLISIAFGCNAPHEDKREENKTLAYTEISTEAGLGDFKHVTGAVGDKWYPEPMGGGGGFFDYNGDGWLDVLLAGGGNWEEDPAKQPQSLFLYKNNGDGTFSETTREAGLQDIVAYSIGFVAADYDNDGDDDFFLSNLRTNMLFRNDNGVFTDVSEAAGITDESIWSSSAMFFDADKDGWLDLYVGNYVEWTPETDIFCPPGGTVKLYCIPAAYTGVASRFFFNNGDGTFRDATEQAGFYPSLGKSLGVVELDYNNDGWSDLAVANDGEGDLLYKNNGNGTFSEIGVRSGMAFSEHGEARAGMGIDSGVIDSTGQTSIVVGNFSDEMVGVYQYIGNESFQDRSASSRVGYPSLLILTFGVLLIDVDLDTDQDIFLANGHVYPDRPAQNKKVKYRQQSQIYLNRGNGLFDLHEPEDGVLADTMVARSVSYGDFDRDGDQDLLITENGGPAHLWRNDSNNRRFLRVKVRGDSGNLDGIGTKIVAKVGDLEMVRRIRTGSSYLSNSERTVTFGLGNHEKVDTLRIIWQNGKESVFSDVLMNQEVLIVEGEAEYQTVELIGQE